VARIHAVLSVVGRKVYVVAMDNRAGVELNGVRTQRAALADGDQIQIGDTILRARFMSEREELREERDEPVARSPVPVAPRFDPGAKVHSTFERITREQLRRPAVENRPHPALPPESPVSLAHRALEMRIYMGQALLDMHHYVGKAHITIGESRDADVFLSSEGLPTQVFPLVRFDVDTYVLTFTSEMEGEVELDGEVCTLRQLLESGRASLDPELPGSFQLRLGLSTRALVHWGGVTFALRFVAPARPVPASRFRNLDHDYLNTLAVSVAMHFTMVLTLLLYPYDARALERREFADVTVTLYHPAGIEPIPWNEPKPPRKKPPKPTEVETTPTPRTGGSVRGPRRVRGRTAAEIRSQIEQVLSSGLGLIDPGTPAPLDLGIGIGSRGKFAVSGLGGDTRSYGPLGGFGQPRTVGPISTRPCLGSADCDGLTAIGPPRTGRHRELGVFEIEEPIVARNALPPDVIRRVINRSKGQIRACYERELQRDRDLEGKIAVKWIIGATGGVVRVIIVENNMGNREVARCISERIKTWRFPPPAGGGTVEVNYPFVFHAI